MSLSISKRWALPLVGGIVGPALGQVVFGGLHSAVLGAVLGAVIGTTLAWPSSTESLSAAWKRWTNTLAWNIVFLSFFALYITAAIIWLAMGLAPFIVYAFPELRETLREMGDVTGAGTSVSHVPIVTVLAWNILLESYSVEPAAQVILQYLFSLLNLILGVFLIWLRPWDRTARLLALGMIGTAAIFNLQAHAAYHVLPAIDYLHMPFHFISGIAYIYALLLFPDGKLFRRRSRPRWFTWPLRVLGLLILTFVGLSFGFTDGEPEGLVMFFGVIIPIVGMISQTFRYRHATTVEERQQSRVLMWALMLAFGLALLFGAIMLGLNTIRPGLSGQTLWELQQFVFLVFPSLFAFIPVTLFVVMVRYRLWDIDHVINRTVVYGAFTVALALVYVASVVLFQWVFGTLTALVIAALFLPLRRRVQTFIDRRFYREKVDFRQAFTDFSREVRTIIDLPELVRVLVNRTTDLLHIAHGAVFLRGTDGTFQLAAACNVPQHEIAGEILHRMSLPLNGDMLDRLQGGGAIERPQDTTFPLLVPLLVPRANRGRDEVTSSLLVGILALGPRLSGQGYSRDDQALLVGLADQAGTAIHVAQLIEEQRAEAQRREATEQRLEAYHNSPVGRAEGMAQALVFQPETALIKMHNLAQQAGNDSNTAGVLDHLPKVLANLDAHLLSGFAEGFLFVRLSESAPELLQVGLRVLVEHLELPDATYVEGRADALVRYELCRQALGASSIAQIAELVSVFENWRKAEGSGLKIGPASFLVDLDRGLLELQPVVEALRAYERVQAAQDRLAYLASAVERLHRVDRFARAELGIADRPVIQRIAESWLAIVTSAISELQTRAQIVCTLLTHHVWRSEVIGLTLSLRNIGRGTALNVRVSVTPTPGYSPIDETVQVARLVPGEETQVELRVELCLAARVDDFRARFVIRYADPRGPDQIEHFADVVSLLTAEGAFQFIPNPYVVGTPLQTGSPLFMGREHLVGFIHENLAAAHRNNLVLIGQRRTGKTSLLKQLPVRLSDAYLPVYLDGQTLGFDPGLPNFFLTLATEITFALEDRGFSIDPPELHHFVDSPASTFEHRFLAAIREMIGDRHLLILLDEFEELEAAVRRGNLPPSVFSFLRHLMQHTDNLSVIFCGTHRLEELAADYWSALFNISLYRQVGFLERPEALRLIQEPVAIYGMRYDDLALEKIWRVTSGHPYFLQLLCHSLVNRYNKTQRSYVTIGDVNAALEEILATGEAHFVYLWTESTIDEQLALTALSRMMPLTGQTTTVQVVDYLIERGVSRERRAVGEALQRLALRNILKANSDAGLGIEDAYRWQLGLLALWVEKYRSFNRVVDEVYR
jgi:GAF domain-containing protein